MDIDKFKSLDVDILDRLYKEQEPMSCGTWDEFLKLPVSDEYKKNKEQRDENKSHVNIKNDISIEKHGNSDKK